MKEYLNKIFLLGVGITNDTSKNILEYILLSLEKGTKSYYVVTPNPEILVYASKHSGFKTILNSARLALCDGIGVISAGKFLGQPFVQRTTGIDFLETVCKAVAKKPITVGFLGGGSGVAERAAECLVSKYPELKVTFIGSRWPQEHSTYEKKYQVSSIKYQAKEKNERILNTQYLIPNTSIDVLFVAFGFPKQEEWMAKNLNKNIYKVAIGVGGAFDYISGQVQRAPVVFQKIGLEWLFRLFFQPWRIKRQFALFTFVLLVLQERFFKQEK